MIDRERALVWYLRVYALVLLAALPATVVPTRWLATAYAWLGFGDWPQLPLVEYLARSASGLYALLGGLVLLMSFDVRRHRPVLLLLGWVSVLGSVYLFALDLWLRLPWWWVVLEGPVVLLTGVLMLVLCRR
jgi:hypothetical protein